MKKSLSFSKGITTAPSDLLSDDTELVESTGAIYRNGEIHPLQKPVSIGTIHDKIVCVHRGSDYTNLITHSGSTLSAYSYADTKLVSIGTYPIEGTFKTATAIGSTLLVSTTEGISYLRFNAKKYTNLGAFPEPTYSVGLAAPKHFKDTTEKVTFTDYIETKGCNAYYDSEDKLCRIEEPEDLRDENSGVVKREVKITANKIDENKTLTYLGYVMKYGKQTDFNAAAQAVVADAYANVKKNKCFAFPFYVRMALRLYDGSYAKISAPMLCLPSIRCNGVLYPADREPSRNSLCRSNSMSYFKSDMNCYELYCYAYLRNMKLWSDIIKDIVIFATPEVLPYSLDGDWKFMQPSDIMRTSTWEACIGVFYKDKKWTYNRVHASSIGVQTDGPLTSAIVPEKLKSDNDIISELTTGMTFYKLFEAPLSDTTISLYLYSMEYMKDGVLENLTSQEQLGVDDYYGWTTKVASNILSYNSRAQLYGIDRYPFKGFSELVNASSGNPFTSYVHIVSDTMDTWVESTCATIGEALLSWYYYPDTNAVEVRFFKDKQGYSLKLKPHPRLNGAYAMVSLPDGSSPTMSSDVAVPTPDPSAHETLSSQIFTSVVNNPFVFEASGDNTVGTGAILGIAANTEPISQGQFGQYLLIVFTTEGIYGMSVNSEGLYSASYPISREVCNNADSITPTGSLVFFTSAKGLMAISGGTVAGMSDQMRGRNPSQFVSIGDGDFLSFLKGCSIAYDYRDSLLHIYSPNRDYHYIYSIPDRTFAMSRNMSKPLLAVASAYPDTLVQEKDGAVYSLLSKPDINVDTARYSGTFTSRPLKLDSSTQLKTIHQILHLCDTANGTLSLRVYGSNDCRHWHELKSLHGKPWKYFTFQYAFANFSAADSFAGTLVDFQPRFTDKMR